MKIQSFVKGSMILIVSNVCMKAVSFFLLPIYTKYLDTTMLGVSDSITSFTGFLLTFLILGLDSAFSAFFYDGTTENHKGKVFNTILFTLTGMSIIPLIFAGFGNIISEILFGTNEYWLIVSVAFCSVSFNLCYLSYSLLVRMENRMAVFGGVNFFASLSMILLNILFVIYFGLGATSLVLSTAIVNFIQLLIYIILNKSKISKKEIDFNLLKTMLRYALPIIPNAIMMWVLSLSDRYVLLYYKGVTAVGIYGVGGRFVLILNVIITSVNTAYSTFAFGKKKEVNSKDSYRKILCSVVFCLMGICFTLSIFSKEIISFFVEKSYYSVNEILQNLLYGQAFFGITSIVSYGIYFEKKSIYGLIATSVGAGINMLFNIIFIPQYGIEAAALTTLIGYMITFVLAYSFAQKVYSCNYDLKKNLLAILVTYVVAYIGSDMNLYGKVVFWLLGIFVLVMLFKGLIVEVIVNLRKYRR